jgi:F-type H+-transporting ATPase subunit epsilon
MRLELITLSGMKMNDDVYEVLLPTADGEIAVFPGHERLISLAVPGVISIRRHKGDHDDRMELFATNGGVIEINAERIRIVVDEADAADEILESEAKAALERAEKLRAQAKTQVDINEAQAMINRHTVRLKVAGLRRHRHKG